MATVKELRKKASDFGIKNYARFPKDELENFVKSASGVLVEDVEVEVEDDSNPYSVISEVNGDVKKPKTSEVPEVVEESTSKEELIEEIGVVGLDVEFKTSPRATPPFTVIKGVVKRQYFDKQDQADYLIIVGFNGREYCKRPDSVKFL